MDKKILTLTLLAIVLFSTSCVVNKPDSRSISNRDYNQRVEVEDAHYIKKLSAVGYASIIGSTAAGAYIGSNMNMIVKYDGEQTVAIKPANIAIGAIIGLSTSLFVNHLLGLNKRVEVNNPQKWIDKANKNYLLLSKSRNNNFRMIHKSAEKSYVLKNMTDAYDFTYAFPKSNYANNVAKQSISASSFTSSDYLDLMQLFPNNSSILDMKKQHILRAKTISNMFSAYDRFPETKINIEKISVPLVKNFNDANIYHKRFVDNEFNKQIVVNAFNDCSVSEAKKLKNLFNNDFYLSSNDLITYKATEASKRNYLNYLYHTNYSELNSQWQILDFYKSYDYFTYKERSGDILENIWDKTISNFNNGDYFIEMLMAIPVINDYKTLGIGKTDINLFIKRKLKMEFENNIRIENTEFISAKDEDYEFWKNHILTTPIVGEFGDYIGFYKGTLINKSIFDIPVRIVLEGNIGMEFNFDSPIFNELFDDSEPSILSMLGTVLLEATGMPQYLRDMENKTKRPITNYIENTFLKKSNSNFAIPIVNPIGINNIGINFQSLISFTYGIVFTEPKLSYEYMTDKITNSAQNRYKAYIDEYQNKEWRNTMYDVLRLKKYDTKDDIELRRRFAEMNVTEEVAASGTNLTNAQIKLMRHPNAKRNNAGYNVLIFSRDNECNDTYSSSIFTQWNDGGYSRKIELDDEMADNNGTYLSASDFPILIRVSYRAKPCSSGKWVSADVLINIPDYYTLEVKPD